MISPLISMNFFKSLSVRLKLLTLLWLVIAVASISYTLLISWRLEGSHQRHRQLALEEFPHRPFDS